MTRPRRLPLAALAACLLAPPAIAQGPRLPELDVESYRLDNGLKVALQRDPSVPRVTVCVAYHVGSKNERAGRTGFAHFFEHMMFRGTEHVPNYDIPLQEAGAQSNAFTSEDMTVYFETVPADYLERALYLEAERLAFLPSALDREKFDTEREVVKNERRQSVENVPYGLSDETILAHLFPEGHPYSWSVIGSMKDLDAATLDDLKRFFAEFYHPGNATLCLVGDFDPILARALIHKYFAPLEPGPEPSPVEAPAAPAHAETIERPDDVELTRLYLAWPAVAFDHPDAPALDMLAEILSGGEASRLYRRLVLGRLATDANASSDTFEAAGRFVIDATAAEGVDPARVQEAIRDELKRLRAEAPSDAELARALAKVETGTYSGLTSPLGRAIRFAIGLAQKDDPTYFLRELERTFRVTPDDVRRVAEQYLVPEALVLEIHPAKDGEPAPEPVVAGPRPTDEPESPLVSRTPEGGPDWSKLPGPSHARGFEPPKAVKRRLDNGLDVWVVPWHTLPLAEVQLLVPAGTADDPDGKSGLATLTASLLDQGTGSKTAVELTEALEGLGADLSVGTSTDETSFRLGVLARNLAPSLDLLGEVLTDPRFDPADVDRERQLQLTDLLQGPSSPSWIAARAFRVLLYGQGHPYGNPADGYPETVKGLTRDDLRDFWRNHIVPEGATLILVGDVEPEAAFATVAEALGAWKGQAPSGPEGPPPPAKPEPGVAYLVDKPGAVQSVLSVGRRWVDRDDPRYFATLVGNRILGGDFLSRLNQNLREEHGFTYGAGSYFRFLRSGSVWAVGTSVRADATAPALREVLDELDALAGDKPFTEEEIALSVSGESRSFPEEFESPASIARILGLMARHDLPDDYLDTFLARLQGVEPTAVSEAMTQVVAPDERLVLVVGDREAVEPKLRELGFREIRLVDPDGRPAK